MTPVCLGVILTENALMYAYRIADYRSPAAELPVRLLPDPILKARASRKDRIAWSYSPKFGTSASWSREVNPLTPGRETLTTIRPSISAPIFAWVPAGHGRGYTYGYRSRAPDTKSSRSWLRPSRLGDGTYRAVRRDRGGCSPRRGSLRGGRGYDCDWRRVRS